MASFFNIARFTRNDKKDGSRKADSPAADIVSPTTPQSPAMSLPSSGSDRPAPRRAPTYFFREENTNLIVKGNFMTLAAKPEYVDNGEWLAHQVVEQYRLLEGMIKVIQEVDQFTGQPLCNYASCPTMSAAEFTYTWLDNQRQPIRIPAAQYITLVQKWILGKINNPDNFPTGEPTYTTSGLPRSAAGSAAAAGGADSDWVGKASGFPPNFENDVKSLYRQMFRCYAHLYHGHWLEPFYHLSATKELNTCFIHFINVGRWFGLLNDKDLRPMQPLIDIWDKKELLCRLNGGHPTAGAPAPLAAPTAAAA